MAENTNLQFEKKLFRKQDIRNIAQFFTDEYLFEKEQNKHSEIHFKISCEDGTVYNHDNVSIFDDGGVIDTKKILTIKYSFYSFGDNSIKNSKSMYFNIDNNDRYSDNTLTISGIEEWVDDVHNRFSILIDTMEPQNNKIVKVKPLLNILSLLSFGIIIYYIIGLLFRNIIMVTSLNNHFNNSILKWGAFGLLGYVPSTFVLTKCYENLIPGYNTILFDKKSAYKHGGINEFAFGPVSHQFFSRLILSKLYKASIIIIVMQIIIEFIKLLFY